MAKTSNLEGVSNRCSTSGITNENDVVLLHKDQSLTAVQPNTLSPCSYLELLLRSIDSCCFRLSQTNSEAVFCAIRPESCLSYYCFHMSYHAGIVPRCRNAENEFRPLHRPSGIGVVERVSDVIVYAAKIISKPASCVLDFGSIRSRIIVVGIKVELEELFDIGAVFIMVALKAPLLDLFGVFIILQFRWHLV